MCTAAYREALTRDYSSTASSAPVPSQCHVTEAEADREGAAAESGPAMTLAKDATVVRDEVIYLG